MLSLATFRHLGIDWQDTSQFTTSSTLLFKNKKISKLKLKPPKLPIIEAESGITIVLFKKVLKTQNNN